MLFPAVARRQPFNQRRQLAGGFKPSALAILRDRPRKPPRLRLIPILPEHPSQLGLTPTVHRLGSRELLPQIHPHVERAIVLKTEPAFRVVELWRTDAQIEQHAVTTGRRNPFRHLRVMAAPNLEPSGETGFVQPPRRRLNGCAIAIAAIQPSIRAARRQHGAGVPTPTDRAVGGPESRPWPERFQHLRQHDRFVDETWHCAWPLAQALPAPKNCVLIRPHAAPSGATAAGSTCTVAGTTFSGARLTG